MAIFYMLLSWKQNAYLTFDIFRCMRCESLIHIIQKSRFQTANTRGLKHDLLALSHRLLLRKEWTGEIFWITNFLYSALAKFDFSFIMHYMSTSHRSHKLHLRVWIIKITQLNLLSKDFVCFQWSNHLQKCCQVLLEIRFLCKLSHRKHTFPVKILKPDNLTHMVPIMLIQVRARDNDS